MHLAIGRYHTLLLRLLPGKASFSPFSSPGGWANVHERIDGVKQVFMQGCHEALEADTLDDLLVCLNGVDEELRGFAYEGAGMGLALFDHLTGKEMDRLQNFATGPGAPYSYTLYVGAGWTPARLRQPIEALVARQDPVSGWMAVDGYGFHEGFFSPRSISEQSVPEGLSNPARQVFDQGLGRSFWFSYEADVDQITQTISAFSPARQHDLWSGIGLAGAYTGVVERAILEQLRMRAGSHAAAIALGVAVATQVRHHANNLAPHTELACRVFCDMSAEQVAKLTDQAFERLTPTEEEPAYQLWRQRIYQHFV